MMTVANKRGEDGDSDGVTRADGTASPLRCQSVFKFRHASSLRDGGCCPGAHTSRVYTMMHDTTAAAVAACGKLAVRTVKKPGRSRALRPVRPEFAVEPEIKI